MNKNNGASASTPARGLTDKQRALLQRCLDDERAWNSTPVTRGNALLAHALIARGLLERSEHSGVHRRVITAAGRATLLNQQVAAA
jgi:hypothetical protein